MKYTGKYYRHAEPTVDLDHEINGQCDLIKKQIKDFETYTNNPQSKAIKKALIETILESL